MLELACIEENLYEKNFIIVHQEKGYKKLMLELHDWHMTPPKEKTKKERVIL